jgi:hypothetical protein
MSKIDFLASVYELFDIVNICFIMQRVGLNHQRLSLIVITKHEKKRLNYIRI